MKDIYAVAGVSKQACHQHRIRQLEKQTTARKFFELADRIRNDHSKVGCRKMALDLRCKGWGRDKTEQLLLQSGYRVYYPPNFTRTTFSQQHLLYPNLIEGLELTNINQLVQTDITYYRVGDRSFYIVFLIDVYSRLIVGYAVNKTLHAEGNIRALRKLFKTREGHNLVGLIHHSDRGSQYVDTEYRALLTEKDIRISMCKQAWQNAYTERINRTIKEEYLDGWKIETCQQLSKYVNKAVTHYNTQRKHKSLKYLTPSEFEHKLKNWDASMRPKMKLYKPPDSYPQNECE
jgi:transposase InsO family protein